MSFHMNLPFVKRNTYNVNSVSHAYRVENLPSQSDRIYVIFFLVFFLLFFFYFVDANNIVSFKYF